MEPSHVGDVLLQSLPPSSCRESEFTPATSSRQGSIPAANAGVGLTEIHRIAEGPVVPPFRQATDLRVLQLHEDVQVLGRPPGEVKPQARGSKRVFDGRVGARTATSFRSEPDFRSEVVPRTSGIAASRCPLRRRAGRTRRRAAQCKAERRKALRARPAPFHHPRPREPIGDTGENAVAVSVLVALPSLGVGWPVGRQRGDRGSRALARELGPSALIRH